MNAPPGTAAASVAYRRYVLGLLMAVGLFNYIDRLCISILIVPIREELGLSDTQIGVLTGLAFSLVYTLMAVPIARLADLGSRKLVIVGSLAVWSLMTAACGFATSFLVLVVLRMGVAIGEAGCVPATQALISDYYPPTERARAIATWQLMFPVGTLIGIAGSGWLAEALGWRQTFFVLGAVGLGLAPFVLLTLREPRRGATDHVKAAAIRTGLAESFRLLWASHAYRRVLIGGALFAYPLNAALFWNAPFYNRVFGLSVADLAWILALLSGGAGAVGLFSGGYLADRLGRRNPRLFMMVPGVAGLAIVPFMLLQYFATHVGVSIACGVVSVMLLNSFMPPQAAAAQTLVHPNLRALAAAMLVLAAGISGAAAGPLLTGVFSDALAGAGHGDDSLRYAIGLSSLLAAVGGAFFLSAARAFAAEIAERSTDGQAPSPG